MIKRSEKSGSALDRLRQKLPVGSGGSESGIGASRTGVPLRLRRFVQPGLQSRFLTTVALLMLFVVTVLVTVTVQYQRSTLRDDLERRVEVLAELVASQPLIRQDAPTSEGLQDVAEFLAEQPDIDFALLLTPENEVLVDASGSDELIGQTVVDESGVVTAAVEGIGTDGTAEPAIREYDGAIHVAQPIVVDGRHVRTVDFAVSLNEVNAKARSLLLRGLLLGFAFLVIGVVATALLVRRITRPLTQLTEAAEDMSRVQIPALIEQLRSGDASTAVPEVQLIDVKSDDEIGRLGGAFNSIQLTTAEVARSQGELLKRGISDIFVQLARRNQSLIDRQLEVIDDLEASERSPDALAGLFKLDHLAARMRRNAESLLVLADEGSTNVRARPVSMTDMIRVAIGEVEQYHRVEVLSVDDAMVKGAAASGMSHLLAEILDNALRNSPETSRVDVVGEMKGDRYRIEVSDQGVGLSPEQLSEYNELLQQPPEMGLTLSRSLGFTVVSRLARQFDLQVELRASDAGGVRATVDIPAEMLGTPAPAPPPLASPTPAPAPAPAAPTTAPPAPVGLADDLAPLTPPVTPVPEVSSTGAAPLPSRTASPRPAEAEPPAPVPSAAAPAVDDAPPAPAFEPMAFDAPTPDPPAEPAADAPTPAMPRRQPLDSATAPPTVEVPPAMPPPADFSTAAPATIEVEPAAPLDAPMAETGFAAPPEPARFEASLTAPFDAAGFEPVAPDAQAGSEAPLPPPPFGAEGVEGVSAGSPPPPFGAEGVEGVSEAPLPPPPFGAEGVEGVSAGSAPPPPFGAEGVSAGSAPPPLPTRRGVDAAPHPVADGAFPTVDAGVPALASPSPMTEIAQRQAPQARSPEQLRQMLNNYRRGQARSRESDSSQGDER